LPPISLDKPFQGGAKVPIKFILDCGDGVTKDTTITVTVTEIFSNGRFGAIAIYTYDNGRTPTDSYTIAGNGQYHVDFPTEKRVHTYVIDVFRGNSLTPVMSKVFTTK
jgi:hypothetical protein